MHLRDKLLLHEIAKRTGLSRITVRRWLRTAQEVEVPKHVRAKGFGKLSGFTGELEQSLKADASRGSGGIGHWGQVWRCPVHS